MILTPLQLMAVDARDSKVLVTAPAGSGKTQVLTQRIASLIREGVNPNQILAITFTRKATEEMKHRLAQEFANDCADDLWISTFHGLGWRLLKAHPDWHARGHGVSLWDPYDRKAAILRCAQECGVKVPPKRPDEEKIVSAPMVAHAYERLKVKSNAVDFADLEELLVFASRSNLLDGYWRHVLVDEYQDTSPAQNVFLDAQAASGASLFVVGDPRQAIYSFRGAEPAIMQDLLRDESWASIHLSQNFRSGLSIVEHANRLADCMRLGLPQMEAMRPQYSLAVTVVRPEWSAGWLGGCEILEGGSSAVLARRWDDLVPFADALESSGVKYRWVRRAEDPFSQDGGRLLLNLLRLTENPKDDWLAEQCDVLLGASPGTVVARRVAAAGGEPYINTSPLLKDMIDRARRMNSLPGRCGEIESGVFEVLGDLGQSFVLAKGIAAKWEMAHPELGVAGFLADWAADPGAMPFEGVREGSVAGVVDLTTVHSAKGLEWDTVVIANACDNAFPLRFESEGPEFQEARRLFYVAVTRACNHLYVEVPNQRVNRAGRPVDAEPSPFVTEMMP